MLLAAHRVRLRARECARLGNPVTAAQLEAIAREIERDASTRNTDPAMLAICVNCGHPTPCCHSPPHG